MQHSYPHCWRCKNPIIFRSTEQWFISMEKNDLRKKALSCIDQVQWIPSWGHDRIYGMVENRPDWCISRQRLWGVPITIFYCAKCKKELLTKEMLDYLVGLVEKSGADYIYEPSPSAIVDELVPKHLNTQIWRMMLESSAAEQAIYSTTSNTKSRTLCRRASTARFSS